MKVSDLMTTTREGRRRKADKFYDSEDDESFDLVRSYNDRIRSFHNDLLCERVLEALAFNASRR